MAFMPHLLLAHGSPDQRTRLGGILEKGGYQVASSGLEDGLDDAGLDGFDALLASPEAVKRHDLLHRRGSRPLIVLAEGGDVRQAVEAIKQGVADYLVLPIDAGELLGAVGNALAALTTQGEDQRRPPFAIIGSSGAMAEVRERIAEVAPTDSAVLIEGESGTGKDFLAHAIHAASLRRSAPFITVNCAAIPDAMIETELFGKPFPEPPGQQSPPAGGRAGLAEAASGGTLYLDEVGELPLEVQVRLLAMLDHQPAADRTSGASPPRIIATSHRNVQQLAERGYFHEALSRHLNETRLQLPALREPTARRHRAGPSSAWPLLPQARQTPAADIGGRRSRHQDLPLARQRAGTEQPNRARGDSLRRRGKSMPRCWPSTQTPRESAISPLPREVGPSPLRTTSSPTSPSTRISSPRRNSLSGSASAEKAYGKGASG